MSGWALRALAAMVLIGALTGPVYQVEDRSPLTDIVILLEDESASQQLSDRPEQMSEAVDALVLQRVTNDAMARWEKVVQDQKHLAAERSKRPSPRPRQKRLPSRTKSMDNANANANATNTEKKPLRRTRTSTNNKPVANKNKRCSKKTTSSSRSSTSPRPRPTRRQTRDPGEGTRGSPVRRIRTASETLPKPKNLRRSKSTSASSLSPPPTRPCLVRDESRLRVDANTSARTPLEAVIEKPKRRVRRCVSDSRSTLSSKSHEQRKKKLVRAPSATDK